MATVAYCARGAGHGAALSVFALVPLLGGCQLLEGTEVHVAELVLGALVFLFACTLCLLFRLNKRLLREVRKRWHVEDQLNESRERLELALWGADIGSWDWDLEADEVRLDQRSAEMLGVEAGEGVLNLHDAHTACQVFRALQEEVLKQPQGSHVEKVMTVGERWLQFTGKRLTHANTGYRALGTLMDVSQAHTYQQRLEQLSTTDSLTGLMNRRHFCERFAVAAVQARRDHSELALAILDIDHFKQLNDRYGHQAGDRVLIHFSALLKGHCRPYDLVARYGGEEFVVLFVGIDRTRAQAVLSRYRDALKAAPLKCDGERLSCRFSAGIAGLEEAERNGNLLDLLVAIADSRLYRAKHAGRDRIFIDEESCRAG